MNYLKRLKKHTGRGLYIYFTSEEVDIGKLKEGQLMKLEPLFKKTL